MLEIPKSEIEMEAKPFARGAFAEIYKAKWRKEDVVVKVLSAFTEEEKQDAKCEVNRTLRLSHPNVVKLFGITICATRVKQTEHGNVTEETLGIVTELAEHGSLDMWIGKIDHEKLRKIAIGIIDGLEFVHSQHVIHRDITPNTILLFGPVDDMIPKISDFGVSKASEGTMTQHTRVGHDLYMAPEVRMHFPSSFTADIFSLAMTLFEMFNEQLASGASEEVQRFILNIHVGRISNIPESCKVPVYLRDVIKRGLSNEPEDRPTLDEYRSTLRGKYTFVFLYVSYICVSVVNRFSE